MKLGCIEVYDDSVVAAIETGMGYEISKICLTETYIALESVIALQAEFYYFEDECVTGCKITTAAKVFHTPDTTSEVALELEGAQELSVSSMLEDINSTLKLLHQWLRIKL